MYAAGVDAGTTRTAAAFAGDGDPQAVQLGAHAFTVPTTVAVADDGSVEIGDAAERIAVRRPDAVARYFKSRVGDDVPVILGGSPWAPALLLAKVQRWAVDQVAHLRGDEPDAVVLTHPAGWGTYRLDVLRQAAVQAGIREPVLLSEPAAAATHCVHGKVAVGTTVAVYDFGGGTFDAAVVRREVDGFAVLGKPQGIERVGGLNVDEAVFAFVGDALGGALADLGEDDLADVVELRRRCSMAKEALADEVNTAVPVRLRNMQTDVRLTRDDLRRMVEPMLAETVVALQRSLESAGVAASDLEAVLLVGGSSRLPLVCETLSAALGGVSVVAEPQPKLAVALGAARHGDVLLRGDTAEPQPQPEPVVPPAPVVASARPAAAAPVDVAVARGGVATLAPVATADTVAAPTVETAPAARSEPVRATPVVEAPAGRRRPIVALLGSLAFFGLAVAVALAGVAARPSLPDRGVISVDGDDGASTVVADLSNPLLVTVSEEGAAAVRASVAIGELPLFASDPAPVENGVALVDIRSNRFLVGGRFHLDVEVLDAAGAVVAEHELDAKTARNGFVSVPGGVTVVGLLIVIAAAEAGLRSIRRTKKRTTGDLVRLAVIGGAMGVLLVGAVGLLGQTEPSFRTAIVAAALCAPGAALLATVAQRWSAPA